MCGAFSRDIALHFSRAAPYHRHAMALLGDLPSRAPRRFGRRGGAALALVVGATLLTGASPRSAAADPPVPIRSEAMRNGGVALAFVGGLGAATGSVLLVASSFGCPDRCEDSASRSRALGAPLLAIGLGALAAGITLIVIGNQKVPRLRGTAEGGPHGLGWTWRF
jgi:hypothetical protein